MITNASINKNLGEDVNSYQAGRITGHSGAWMLGKDANIPGLLLPAQPRVGDRFQSENVPGITRGDDEVISISETVKVPAGAFCHCIKVKERASDGGTEFKLHAPGIGVIAETDADGDLRLKSHSTK